MKTTTEKLKRIHGSKPSRKTPAKIFQTRVWLENIFATHHIGLKEFEQRIRGAGEKSYLPTKWLKGLNCASRNAANKVEKIFPGSIDIYNLPLYDLIENKPLTKKSVFALTNCYHSSSKNLYTWKFPNDWGVTPSSGDSHKKFKPVDNLPDWQVPNDGYGGMLSPLLPPPLREDSNALVSRGDIFGFISIIALIREAECNLDHEAFQLHIMNAYRALPAVARLKVFKRRWHELLDLLKSLHSRVPLSQLSFRADKDILKQQIEAEFYITTREIRPRDPTTFRFIENPDPVVFATFN